MERGLYVDGRWRAASDGGTTEVVNPATETVIGTAAAGTVADATDAVTAARRAFDDGRWSGLTPAERAAVLGRLHEALTGRIERHVALSVAESGAPRGQSAAFVASGLAHLEYAITVATSE